MRGDQKALSLTYNSSVQNKIKKVYLLLIVARLRKRHAQYDLGYKYCVHFSHRRLFAYDMEKTELRSVMR